MNKREVLIATIRLQGLPSSGRSLALIFIAIVPLILVAVACSQDHDPTSTPATFSQDVRREEIVDMVCGPQAGEDCLSELCLDANNCPSTISLSNEAVFQFVAEYSRCEGCNTPAFTIHEGIDKCVEYQVSDSSGRWKVDFWVSENCNFRYGSPSKSRIEVSVSKSERRIVGISPPVEYIADPLYCQKGSDCICLSGSGVPFVGCGNYFYAPLSWAGAYQCDMCACESNRCMERPGF